MSVTIIGAPTTQIVSASTLPLPAGAATQTTLAELLTELAQKLEDGGNVVVTSLPAITGTVTANPATYYGKTITYVPVAQGAAGTTELAAASASNKHKIIGGMLTMSLAGTLKFNDGTVDLTGPMTFAANGGMVVPESPVPFCETAGTNRPMNLITTVGNANGVIAILTEA